MKKAIMLLLTVLAVVFSLAGSYVSEWTDYNESDPGITLLG